LTGEGHGLMIRFRLSIFERYRKRFQSDEVFPAGDRSPASAFVKEK
jgi:hypothetical protein